jgi:hypothetical protein
VWLLLAQDSPADLGSNPWLTLVNFGVLGLVLFFTFFKPKIHTSSEVNYLRDQVEHERDARAKVEEENARLHALVEEQVIPALSRSTDLIARQLARGSGTSE